MAAKRKYGTLVADTVTTVTLTQPGQRIGVMNLSGTARITFTINGATPTTTIGSADDQWIVPAVIGQVTVTDETTAGVIKLISTGTPEFAVISY